MLQAAWHKASVPGLGSCCGTAMADCIDGDSEPASDMIASWDENVERAYGRVGAADLARSRSRNRPRCQRLLEAVLCRFKNRSLIFMLPLEEC